MYYIILYYIILYYIILCVYRYRVRRYAVQQTMIGCSRYTGTHSTPSDIQCVANVIAACSDVLEIDTSCICLHVVCNTVACCKVFYAVVMYCLVSNTVHVCVYTYVCIYIYIYIIWLLYIYIYIHIAQYRVQAEEQKDLEDKEECESDRAEDPFGPVKKHAAPSPKHRKPSVPSSEVPELRAPKHRKR